MARQTTDPALSAEDVAGWPDDRLVAALASLGAHDAFLDAEIVPFTIDAYREAVKTRYAARMKTITDQIIGSGAFGKMGKSLAAMVRSQASVSGLAGFRTRSDLVKILGNPSALGVVGTGSEIAKIKGLIGAGVDPGAIGMSHAAGQLAKIKGQVEATGNLGIAASKLAADPAIFKGLTAGDRFDVVSKPTLPLRTISIPPRPDYDAQTAASVKQIVSFEADSIDLAATQARELTTLNAKVETLTARADTTNARLTDIASSTAPRWVAYATFIAASVSVVAAIAGIVVAVWLSQPHPSAAVAAPIVTPAVSTTP